MQDGLNGLSNRSHGAIMKKAAKHGLTILLGFAVAVWASNISAQDFASGPDRTDLIELYTSEGCSSCPPADRLLNALWKSEGLWSDFVPVAFHVDYWNYIGWTDPFSSSQYSSRQRKYSKEWNARTIYTPCFVVNGVARRGLQYGSSNDRPGTLKASVDKNKITVVFTPSTPAKEAITAWMAPLTGLESISVAAGENRGRQLDHRFVALGIESRKMKSSGNTFSAILDLPQNSRTKAVAIWVSAGKSLKPLQATGGWIDP